VALVTLALLVGAVGVLLSLWATHKTKAAERGWAESFESMQAFATRYPSTTTNTAALELAVLSASLGISLDTPSIEGTSQERIQAARARVRLARDEGSRVMPLVAFLGAEAGKADDGKIDIPPAPVAEFLSRHAGEIAAIEAHVLEKDSISWACDIHKGGDSPLPSLGGHRLLAGVFLVHALEAARAGSHSAAQRALEASWKLNLVLRERPELVTQHLAMVIAGLHNAVLRRMTVPLGEWPERLGSQDWRRSVERSYQAEAFMFGRIGTDGSPSHAGTGPATLLGRLWLQPSIADHSDRIRRMAVELKQQDACAVDSESFARRMEAEIPWWNTFSTIAMPSLARGWDNVARAMLDDELTGLVVRAKAEVGGAKTRALPLATSPSSVCAGMSWVSRPQANGDLEIAADRNPFKDPRSAPPLSFRVHRH
jgi:hypothetical protein